MPGGEQWRERAACAGHDPELFFGTGAAVSTAKKICRGCPVTAECLDYALAREAGRTTHGVWGGKSADERAAILRRRRGKADRPCAECGDTYSPRHHTQRYCSRRCSAAARHRTRQQSRQRERRGQGVA